MESQTNVAENYQGRGALDAFLNLLHLIALGWAAIAFGRLMFWIISKFFSPSFINYYNTASQSDLKFSIASLIIIVPIYLGVAGYLHKQYKLGQLNHQSAIYRWLTYFMLLVSALNIIGSLIAIVFNLLNGAEDALATILKILTVLVIALGIFGYYAYDLRRSDYSKRSLVSLVAVIVVTVIVSVSVIGSFFLIDSPAVSQMKNQDQQRAQALSQLNAMIVSHHLNSGELPADLSDNRFAGLVDPETEVPYEYRVLSEDQFELCATFALAAPDSSENNYYRPIGVGEDWYFHDEGRQCFVLNAVLDKNVPPTKILE